MPERKLDNDTKNIVSHLMHDESRVVLGSVVLSPEGRTYPELADDLRNFHDADKMPRSVVDKIVKGLTLTGLVDLERTGSGTHNLVTSTPLGRLAYTSFGAMIGEIDTLRTSEAVNRIVNGVPEHLLGSVVSGLQQRIQPKNP